MTSNDDDDDVDVGDVDRQTADDAIGRLEFLPSGLSPHRGGRRAKTVEVALGVGAIGRARRHTVTYLGKRVG